PGARGPSRSLRTTSPPLLGLHHRCHRLAEPNATDSHWAGGRSDPGSGRGDPASGGTQSAR
ncbi:UNVERIFIED_CONTAM: hypothetical protein NY100_18935, partial [Prevotella sp. 15_C9]